LANKTLYVGNISYSSTEQSLQEAFKQYGATNVRIIEGRGFAFLDIEADQLEAAVADKNGAQLDGRTLTVNEARPKGEGGGGGGRSGGGGGGGRGVEAAVAADPAVAVMAAAVAAMAEAAAVVAAAVADATKS
jgi:cold-inducible RNA-binding protein